MRGSLDLKGVANSQVENHCLRGFLEGHHSHLSAHVLSKILPADVGHDPCRQRITQHVNHGAEAIPGKPRWTVSFSNLNGERVESHPQPASVRPLHRHRAVTAIAGREAPNAPTVGLKQLRKPLLATGPVFRGASLGVTIYNLKKAPFSLLNSGTSVAQLAWIIGVP